MVFVRAIIQCPMVGTVTGVEYPVPRANGAADGFRGVGGRMVHLVGGLTVLGRASPLTGSGVPAAGSLIIHSQTGAARLGAGVIRSNGIPSARFTIPHKAGPEAIAIGGNAHQRNPARYERPNPGRLRRNGAHPDAEPHGPGW